MRRPVELHRDVVRREEEIRRLVGVEVVLGDVRDAQARQSVADEALRRGLRLALRAPRVARRRQKRKRLRVRLRRVFILLIRVARGASSLVERVVAGRREELATDAPRVVRDQERLRPLEVPRVEPREPSPRALVEPHVRFARIARADRRASPRGARELVRLERVRVCLERVVEPRPRRVAPRPPPERRVPPRREAEVLRAERLNGAVGEEVQRAPRRLARPRATLGVRPHEVGEVLLVRPRVRDARALARDEGREPRLERRAERSRGRLPEERVRPERHRDLNERRPRR